MSLPDEMLTEIVKFASPPSDATSLNTANMCALRSLVGVNRRFYQISIPFLYRCIPLSYSNTRCDDNNNNERLSLLVRTLRKDPALGKFCRELRFSLISPRHGTTKVGLYDPEFNINLAMEVVDLLPKTTTLTIAQTTVSGIRPKYIASLLSKCLTTMSVKNVLILGPIGINDRGVFRKTIKRMPPRGIDKLHLGCGMWTDWTRDLLVSWPASIQTLEMFADTTIPRNTKDFQTMLLPFQQSLKTLSLSSATFALDRADILPDVSAMTALESLTMSAFLPTGPEENNKTYSPAQGDRLLGPNLQKLELVFGRAGHYAPAVTHGGGNEQRWVREFARDVLGRKASLREIKVIFTPEWCSDYGMGLRRNSPMYPWDRLEVLNNEFSHTGLQVTGGRNIVIRQ